MDRTVLPLFIGQLFPLEAISIPIEKTWQFTGYRFLVPGFTSSELMRYAILRLRRAEANELFLLLMRKN